MEVEVGRRNKTERETNYWLAFILNSKGSRPSTTLVIIKQKETQFVI